MTTSSNSRRSWFGADPGGAGNFGVALLHDDGTTDQGVVSCADEAIAWLHNHLDHRSLAGAGIDSPLWWSSAKSSDRNVDRKLRKHYGLASGTVQTGNSLRGSVLIQGSILVTLLRRNFPGLPITEAHPKALAKALFPVNEFCGVQSCWEIELEGISEHARDATVSALAAREGFEGRWPCDLGADRHTSEQEQQNHWLGPIHYFWPEKI